MRPGSADMMHHALNFAAGWWLILGAFGTGAIIGLGFHREEFLGGYNSLRRRLTRLGHIALAALGGLNVLYGLSPVPSRPGPAANWTGWLFLAGAVAMPAVCFLSAWRVGFRHLFFVPVTLLLGAVALVLLQLSS